MAFKTPDIVNILKDIEKASDRVREIEKAEGHLRPNGYRPVYRALYFLQHITGKDGDREIEDLVEQEFIAAAVKARHKLNLLQLDKEEEVAKLVARIENKFI